MSRSEAIARTGSDAVGKPLRFRRFKQAAKCVRGFTPSAGRGQRRVTAARFKPPNTENCSSMRATCPAQLSRKTAWSSEE